MREWQIVLNGKAMYEDELPEEISDEFYDMWYILSFIPDGAGVRVGPLIEEIKE